MTPREIFNTVKTHLLTQGEQAVMYGGYACAYRSPDGKKCAVGCLITDEAYSPNLEGHSISKWVVRAALAASGIDLLDGGLALLYELQRIHDAVHPSKWESALNDVEHLLDKRHYGA